MKRTKDAPGLQLYYDALQEIFSKQSSVLTGVLTHYGERGRNDEERLRQFLSNVLPRRFSIGTGLIVSADVHQQASPQTDIIISDQFWNSPLYRELVADVYPIETVYATIEVKGLLEKAAKGRGQRKSDLDQCLEHIAAVRALAKHKTYVRYTARSKSEDEPHTKVVHSERFHISLPPRGYIFAYAKKGWRTLDAFKSDLTDKLQKHRNAHLHGIVVLDKDWFAYQEAHTGAEVRVHAFSGNSLLKFTNTLLRGIQTIPMDIASIDDYHRAGLYKSVVAGHPGDSPYLGEPEPSDTPD